MAETFTVVPSDPNLGPNLVCVPVVGTGQATHLGKTRESSEVFIDVSTPVCHAETRTVTLTAANGDKLKLALTGQSCDTGATTGTTGIAHDSWVVTGGTGKFKEATGRGTNTAIINGPARTAVTTFSGTLSLRGDR